MGRERWIRLDQQRSGLRGGHVPRFDRKSLAGLEPSTGISILTLDKFVEAVNAKISLLKAATRMGAFKVAMAYLRDLEVGDPTRHEAELVFNRIFSHRTFHDDLDQPGAAISQRESRPLTDYMFHRLMERADSDDIPVQIHTGYLAGHWGALQGTKASLLIPVFQKYRRVRFDIFHGSWPWTSELGAIAKNYPNVYPDLCWAWAANTTHAERALSEWLDCVPFNKILAYGADTLWPWCDVGYAIQARIGIARVLEQKIEAGYFSPRTAEEVAEAIMLKNGEQLFGVS